jgi:uncharacterized protein YndB with AHSA1/START domain
MKIVKYVGIFILFLVVAVLGMMFMAPQNVMFVVSQDVNAPLAKTWDYTMNPANLPKWIDGLSKIEHQSGEFNAVGSKTAFIYNEGKEDMTMIETITAYEPEKQFAFKGEVTDMMSVVSNSSFTALDSNKSNITIKTTITAESFGMRLFMYNQEGMRKRSKEQYAKLAKLIEQE